MTGIDRLLDPAAIAIVGLSADSAKHGRRVLTNLRNLGFEGQIWGVNPSLPNIDGVNMVATVADLPNPPDLVVCAVPGHAVIDVIRQCSGVGAAIVFASGFGESGPAGVEQQGELLAESAKAGVRMLGPNSGGLIRPNRHLAASFLTCLERPADEIRSGQVAVVTQSGGTGSYLHNLAADRGGGLALSISTGNEGDLGVGEVIGAVADLDEVKAIVAVIETVRDGPVFLKAVEKAQGMGKPVIACRIGMGNRGRSLMTSHTGAVAIPESVFDGVMQSLGVLVAETPGEALEVAQVMVNAKPSNGNRCSIVTHSGGLAILLSDLAERHGLELPSPGEGLQDTLEPLLDHGAATNPLDLGGIIGGPARFAKAVEDVGNSGEYDMVLAVSSAHSPDHSSIRTESLVNLQSQASVVLLSMAGSQAEPGLQRLRALSYPVTEEPRAAILAMVGLGRLSQEKRDTTIEPLSGEIASWGLPLIEGVVVSSAASAVTAAETIGYPVVVKVDSPQIHHKTEVDGVRIDLKTAESVGSAFSEVIDSAADSGYAVSKVRVEKYRPGMEIMVGSVNDPIFGPIVSVGLGGIFAELTGDVVFAPGPVDVGGARLLIDRLRLRPALDGFRGYPAADVDELASIVSITSRGLVGSDLAEIELNPLIWDGSSWVAVDWLVVRNE
jgi:acetate---CoA ligase (ADP-forming)